MLSMPIGNELTGCNSKSASHTSINISSQAAARKAGGSDLELSDTNDHMVAALLLESE